MRKFTEQIGRGESCPGEEGRRAAAAEAVDECEAEMQHILREVADFVEEWRYGELPVFCDMWGERREWAPRDERRAANERRTERPLVSHIWWTRLVERLHEQGLTQQKGGSQERWVILLPTREHLDRWLHNNGFQPVMVQHLRESDQFTRFMLYKRPVTGVPKPLAHELVLQELQLRQRMFDKGGEYFCEQPPRGHASTGLKTVRLSSDGQTASQAHMALCGGALNCPPEGILSCQEGGRTPKAHHTCNLELHDTHIEFSMRWQGQSPTLRVPLDAMHAILVQTETGNTRPASISFIVAHSPEWLLRQNARKGCTHLGFDFLLHTVRPVERIEALDELMAERLESSGFDARDHAAWGGEDGGSDDDDDGPCDDKSSTSRYCLLHFTYMNPSSLDRLNKLKTGLETADEEGSTDEDVDEEKGGGEALPWGRVVTCAVDAAKCTLAEYMCDFAARMQSRLKRTKQLAPKTAPVVPLGASGGSSEGWLSFRASAPLCADASGDDEWMLVPMWESQALAEVRSHREFLSIPSPSADGTTSVWLLCIALRLPLDMRDAAVVFMAEAGERKCMQVVIFWRALTRPPLFLTNVRLEYSQRLEACFRLSGIPSFWGDPFERVVLVELWSTFKDMDPEAFAMSGGFRGLEMRLGTTSRSNTKDRDPDVEHGFLHSPKEGEEEDEDSDEDENSEDSEDEDSEGDDGDEDADVDAGDGEADGYDGYDSEGWASEGTPDTTGNGGAGVVPGGDGEECNAGTHTHTHGCRPPPLYTLNLERSACVNMRTHC